MRRIPTLLALAWLALTVLAFALWAVTGVSPDPKAALALCGGSFAAAFIVANDPDGP